MFAVEQIRGGNQVLAQKSISRLKAFTKLDWTQTNRKKKRLELWQSNDETDLHFFNAIGGKLGNGPPDDKRNFHQLLAR